MIKDRIVPKMGPHIYIIIPEGYLLVFSFMKKVMILQDTDKDR